MKYFELSSNLKGSAVQFSIKRNSKKEKFDFKIYSNLFYGRFDQVSLPVVFEHSSGSQVYDILDTGWNGVFLISRRLVEILEFNNFKGWSQYPIVLEKPNLSQEFGEYVGLSITGRCKGVSPKNKIIKKREVVGGPVDKYFKGLNIEGHDGNDFFTSEDYSGIFISEKVANALKGKFSYLRIEPLDDYETLIL